MKVAKYAEGLVVKNEGISIILKFSVIAGMFSRGSKTQENGGVLYGYKLSNIQEYRILGFTDPFQEDKISLFRFDRLDSSHIDLINNKWIDDKSIMYLGDWHSHPSYKSYASNLDRSTWKRISKKAKTNSSILVFSIVSSNEILYCVYRKRGKEIFSFKITKKLEDQFVVI